MALPTSADAGPWDEKQTLYKRYAISSLRMGVIPVFLRGSDTWLYSSTHGAVVQL
ncbi:MAG: hypothetical protein JWO67_6323 [Streptosporangiaceae bacterium]|nr:hypothetical protein [Streptosporangiaceae bacterium]